MVTSCSGAPPPDRAELGGGEIRWRPFCAMPPQAAGQGAAALMEVAGAATTLPEWSFPLLAPASCGHSAPIGGAKSGGTLQPDRLHTGVPGFQAPGAVPAPTVGGRACAGAARHTYTVSHTHCITCSTNLSSIVSAERVLQHHASRRLFTAPLSHPLRLRPQLTLLSSASQVRPNRSGGGG